MLARWVTDGARFENWQERVLGRLETLYSFRDGDRLGDIVLSHAVLFVRYGTLYRRATHEKDVEECE